MARILDRYSSAVRSSNLKSGDDRRHDDPAANVTDTDVLGAFAFAAKQKPLAVALARLFTGDNRAASAIVQILADMAFGRARMLEIKLSRSGAQDMARAVLAWHRDGACKACGGHGYALVCDARIGEGRAELSERPCIACRGRGKVRFDTAFSLETLDIAHWVLAEIEREQAGAGQAAMRALAGKMKL